MVIPNDGGLEAKCSEPNVFDSEKESIAMRPRGSHAAPYQEIQHLQTCHAFG